MGVGIHFRRLEKCYRMGVIPVNWFRTLLAGALLVVALAGCDTVSPNTPTTAPVPNPNSTAYPAPQPTDDPSVYPAPGEAAAYPAP